MNEHITDMEVEHRTAIITGATGILGAFAAQTLAKKGFNLALLDRNPDRLAMLVNSIRLPESCILARNTDLLNPVDTVSAAEATVTKFGRVDVLMHLIGGWTGGKTLVEAPEADLEFMLNQHIRSSFHVIKAFVPYLVQNGWGRVIMITSPFASRPGSKGGPYSAGKAGQEALMMTLAQELKGTGVTANMIQVKTIDVKRAKVSDASPENAAWSTPEEITASILYLLSEEANTINGAKIPLYGS
jgi:NAD(P)-dependent dehydrogenase (short-subunit alcohol dehydrogenase family)